uniref:Uncharacterized protein n=1 Tax=Picea glauca TaxID=3330 RepID=A0A101M4F0_PICGL|nr:hypothetical protein ABT39_MTgene469 [Picea glauca]QHR91232.1 hypothetical protein Q903MT_gene5264 [Picea sitchensis]
MMLAFGCNLPHRTAPAPHTLVGFHSPVGRRSPHSQFLLKGKRVAQLKDLASAMSVFIM